MKILEIRDELVIVNVNGNITTRPTTPYYELKYTTFENARIAYSFGAGSFVRETYDDRIFNCWHEGRQVQFRQDLSNQLALCIQHYEYTSDGTEYYELFEKAYREAAHLGMLDTYLGHLEEVQFHKEDGWVINEVFRIDLKGNAYTRREDDAGWHSLCIVMQESGHSSAPTRDELMNKEGEIVSVGALTMTILSKVLFLIDPEAQEPGFTKYLPLGLRMRLNQLRGGEVT